MTWACEATRDALNQSLNGLNAACIPPTCLADALVLGLLKKVTDFSELAVWLDRQQGYH